MVFIANINRVFEIIKVSVSLQTQCFEELNIIIISVVNFITPPPPDLQKLVKFCLLVFVVVLFSSVIIFWVMHQQAIKSLIKVYNYTRNS